jgi:spheroidene monooxygenase
MSETLESPIKTETAPVGASTAAPQQFAGAQTCAVSVLALVDIRANSRAWGYWHFLLCRFALQQSSGLRFFKVLGSGHEGGFGLRPSTSRQGLFCVFDDDAAADRFLETSTTIAAYRRHAREFFSVKLRAFNSRGSWSGRGLPISIATPETGPVAALTRASIRPAVARAFWKKAPPAEQALAAAPGCRLSAGLGEAPLLRQATFSIWDSTRCMDNYARTGAHLDAIRAAHQGRFFSESMFVRFVPYGASGTWKAQSFG